MIWWGTIRYTVVNIQVSVASVSAFVVMTGLLHAVREVSGVGVIGRSTITKSFTVSQCCRCRKAGLHTRFSNSVSNAGVI